MSRVVPSSMSRSAPAGTHASMRDGHHLWGRRIRAAILVMRPELGVMAMVSAYVGADGRFSMDLLLAVLAIFLLTAGSMTFNDYFDRDLDRAAHPNRPIPAGILSSREALHFSLVSFAVATVLSLLVNPWCFALAVFGIAFLVLYETQFKERGFLGNLVVAALSGLAFIVGGAVSAGRGRRHCPPL